ncbi:MAG: DUF3025 domain-containing protein [Comamonadaceae bacterium]|nr:DUF3025 domain-containing protein [Burkholderiales bacterium]MEB2348808.1 DUF3025 domain-containing protein [Comamonadaceae bacterium]
MPPEAPVARQAAAIDWDVPWLRPYAATGRACVLALERGLPVHAALAACAAAPPVRFVPHALLPPGTAYEAYIHATRQVPTRDNLHDLFNGLVWLHFPRAKARLNRLQAGAIAREGVRPVRGPLRDAATVFDENGALLLAPDALWHALRERDWRRLFVDLRLLWPQARPVLFGHALLEKLVSPRKSVVAHVYQARTAIKSVAIDAWLARDLTAAHLACKPFAPLPVLGVPGWCAASENFCFYDDSTVFRPPRRS